ncbi:MAG: type IV pilin [Methanoregula sp.]|nr:type IV pilin [Methanoregula sp.]
MHYLNRLSRENGDDGVSPVVGVMLMLVVTIIIAAVVSGFAGGLIGGNNQKTPTLAMDVKIANTGIAAGSGFSATVLSISEPTATKNLKIATSWVTTIKDSSAGTVGQSIVGGNTTTAKVPYGFGPGVSVGNTIAPYAPTQNFGNFTLTQGTGLVAEPVSSYTYGSGLSSADMVTVLGTNWDQLRAGDLVSVRLIYIPNGKTVFQKDVVVIGV